MSNPLVEEIVARALPLIHVEREAEQLDSQEAYDAFRARHADLNRQVINQLRVCGWMRDDATTEDMREIYYAVLRHPALEGSASDRATARRIAQPAAAGLLWCGGVHYHRAGSDHGTGRPKALSVIRIPAAVMSSSLLPVSVSARRVLILGLVAGYVDALSFVDLGGVFAGAMTGNTTHMGASFISGSWQHGLILVGVLGVFFLAAILSGLMRLLWSPAYGVMVMTIFMVLAQIVHGSSLRYWGEFLVLPALLAVQGETIAKFSGTPMPTIVVTTNLLKAASGIAEWVASYLAPDRNTRPVAGSIFLPLLS